MHVQDRVLRYDYQLTSALYCRASLARALARRVSAVRLYLSMLYVHLQ